jgi:polyisoprenoid-binding protein YceI
MRTRALLFVSLSTLLTFAVAPAPAGAKQFDFKDPKAVNAVVVSLDSVLEPVVGTAMGVTGGIDFDPANPKAATGKIVIDVNSLDFGHQRYSDTAKGANVLDAARYPTMEFVLKQVKSAKKRGENVWEGNVVGDLTCRGVTKELTVPVRVSYLEGGAAKRNRGMAGDLLVLRTTFKFRRSDFKVAPQVNADLVADEIEVRASIVGLCPAP